jgi:hypothetical protein
MALNGLGGKIFIPEELRDLVSAGRVLLRLDDDLLFVLCGARADVTRRFDQAVEND